jgi:hypothetical protein
MTATPSNMVPTPRLQAPARRVVSTMMVRGRREMAPEHPSPTTVSTRSQGRPGANSHGPPQQRRTANQHPPPCLRATARRVDRGCRLNNTRQHEGNNNDHTAATTTAVAPPRATAHGVEPGSSNNGEGTTLTNPWCQPTWVSILTWPTCTHTHTHTHEYPHP